MSPQLAERIQPGTTLAPAEQVKLLEAPIFFPPEFKDWLADYVATNIPMIPYSNVLGARLNIARSADFIATSESTGSSSYTDLATVGPQLQNIVDGTFIFFYGAQCRSRMAPSYNAATPSDNESLRGTEGEIAMSRVSLKVMKNNNLNSVKLQYKTGAAFARRWLVALRIGTG